MILVLLVLRPQCNSLVDLLLGKTFIVDGRTVLLLSLLVHLPRQVLKALRLSIFVHDLFAEHVDLPLVLLIL